MVLAHEIKGVEFALEKEEERVSDRASDCTATGPTANPNKRAKQQ